VAETWEEEQPRDWKQRLWHGEHQEISGEEEEELRHAALFGVQRMDLVPLAEFLKRGLPLDWSLRVELVQAITGEGKSPLKLTLGKRGGKGRGTAYSAAETARRDIEIGAFVQHQLDTFGGPLTAALKAAETEFDIKVGVARKAWDRFAALTIKPSWPLDD
jgi:hypothetical protein